MTTTRRALISVTDKQGIVEFARGLSALGFEVVSTGGTAKALRDGGVTVTDVATITGFPEILGGRVKTLHPKVHGGILARLDDEAHRAEMATHGIAPIEIVAVNLYAFERAAGREGASVESVIEEIDIGGPTLLRAAAKNHAHVTVVVDPRDYSRVLDALKGAGLPLEARRDLATKVYRHTSHYDREVAGFFDRQGDQKVFPETYVAQYRKVQDLRYGENPHQAGAFYREQDPPVGSLGDAKQRQGKALSFNNLLDADSAWNLAMDLGSEAVVYVKHNNPCGAAQHRELTEAVKLARACDPVSAFGAVVAIGREVDEASAEILGESFTEVIIAPSFSTGALKAFEKKKNLRVLEMGVAARRAHPGSEIRCVNGGALVQVRDLVADPSEEIAGAKVATSRAPTPEELAALSFNWIVAKHVRSNAIVFGHADRVVAVGAGQMSRIDSVRLCGLKGGDALKGTVVASDAFFPFRDGVDMLAQAGATAIVQPGGSIRDEEVIQAANEHGVAMLVTGVRHFRH